MSFLCSLDAASSSRSRGEQAESSSDVDGMSGSIHSLVLQEAAQIGNAR
jgi:hypothetical protein